MPLLNVARLRSSACLPVTFHCLISVTPLSPFTLALVSAVTPLLSTSSTMATPPDDETDPMSNRYIPRAARAVPHEEVVHTIEFRKITYPLTDRPAELWIVETNHRGHKHWKTLERFLDDFAICPLGAPPDYAMASCAHLETLALQWREYYNVPHPFPNGGPPQVQELRRHVLPQHTRLSPTNNHYFELVGEGLPFAILKAIRL